MVATPEEKERIFFQIYRNLENELIKMTDSIHFCEDNLEVFSINLATFILRCNVEGESIMKELYRRTDEYNKQVSQGISQKDIFEKLRDNISNKYKLRTKKIRIFSNIFYFKEKYSEDFSPFDYKDSHGENIPKIYNSLKHDRANNLHKATLEAAINSLGALFILNYYYNHTHADSNIFGPKKALIEPILLAGYDLDKLPVEEVNSYLDECLSYEWFQIESWEHKEYVIENLKNQIEHMLTAHTEDINRSLDELLSMRSRYQSLFDDFNNPFFIPSYDVLPNIGESVQTIKQKLEIHLSQ
ncbi:hypothetical protein AALM99_07030 [Lactococcus muris]|uniref:Uncharacterized protein n=1 Tax=Lactococcus muris TaxID=2941330 RepID=A0ABV4D8Z2_9LACT